MEIVKLMTVEEFDQFVKLPENKNRRIELINGEIVEMSSAVPHGIAQVKISSPMLTFSEEKQLGYIMTEVEYRLPEDPHNSVIPDISFVAGMDTVLPQCGAVPRMPDLAPDDTYKEMRAKAAYDLEKGVKQVWLVFIEKRLVKIYRQDADIDILTENDTINGGDTLPGFTLAVRAIFA